MRTLILCLFIPVILYSQEGSSSDIFKKIGFQDYYYLFIGSGGVQKHFADSNFYYWRMKDLGLSHIVTYADETINTSFGQYNAALNNGYNIKIMDARLDRYRNGKYFPQFAPYPYGYSAGNHFNSLPYEIGGSKASLVSEEDKWGFGNINHSSYWFRETDSTRHSYTDFENGNEIKVIKYDINSDTAHVMLKGTLPLDHQPQDTSIATFGQTFKIGIKAKLFPIGGANEIVAKITIYHARKSPPFIQAGKLSLVDTAANDAKSSFEVFIMSDDFRSGNYEQLLYGSFQKLNIWNNLEIEIYWNATRTLSIDQICIFDDFYERLFYTDVSASEKKIKDAIQEYAAGQFSHPNYDNLYMDEPAPLNYRGYGKVSEIAASLPNGKWIGGAIYAYPENSLAIANHLRRPYYTMIDYYPFEGNTSYSNKDVQSALDRLISRPDNGSTAGLRAAINWAHNFNDILSDDIPFYHCMQVQAEAKKDEKSSWVGVKRAPTEQEIFVQGYLAACYGATGLMYYALYTSTDHPLPTNPDGPGTSIWGLFDQIKNPFTGDYSQWQDKSIPVEPNNRFYAVKELNQEMDKIGPTLLQLTWLNGVSYSKENIPAGYITGIQSYNCPQDTSCLEPKNESFVELGMFKKKNEITDLLEYFMIVNRRCSPGEIRKIKTSINKSGIGFTNWGISEIGTSNKWTIHEIDNFSVEFDPGKGKLFRLAPVVRQGGNLLYDETIFGNHTLKSEPLFIKSGAVLTVNGNYSAYKNIVIESGGELNLGSQGHLSFHDGAKLIIHGQFNHTGTAVNKTLITFPEQVGEMN